MATPNAAKRPMKIILVEESSQDRARFSTMLRGSAVSGQSATEMPPSPYEYEVYEAVNHERAAALCASIHPDLVIIGVRGELGEGQDLCRQIRERDDKRHTGIIFLSYLQEVPSNLSVECLELGADDFITAHMPPREVMARVNVVLRMKAMTDELRSANHRLEILSLTDELTGLHNMRSFNVEYTKMLAACRSGQFGMGVVMLDLDNFKDVNDEANHLVGSHVISQVGKLIHLAQIFGADACPARYGGDEYIICAPADSAHNMLERAELLRDLIGKAIFKKDGFTIGVTASIGVSYVDAGFDGKQDDPIKAADVMLYRSKDQGRNRANAMILRYPVDFNHVGRPHLVDGDAGRDDHNVARIDNLKALK